MKILGIDPGLDRTGWAVLEKTGSAPPVLAASGLIHTPPRMPLEKRLLHIFDTLSLLIKEQQPAEAAIEEVFFSKRASTQASTTHARGVILLACEKGGLVISAYNPLTIKKTISGSGSAEKKQMQRAVQLTLKLAAVPEPDDVADAMAAALCHLRLAPFAKALAAAKARVPAKAGARC
ncbi:MAG TPA: crossover junction endodeoxyribonuclease RuvC [Elusimicrobiales bacterium]|nr:crossover junction endodeoxyribonuclease RuvC [Elusimicrobiales bacterium]